jgi:hypothetical protein
LALFQERNVKPPRADDATRWTFPWTTASQQGGLVNFSVTVAEGSTVLS